MLMHISPMLTQKKQTEGAEVIKITEELINPPPSELGVGGFKKTHQNMRFEDQRLSFQLYMDEDIFQLIRLIIFKRTAGVTNQYSLS